MVAAQKRTSVGGTAQWPLALEEELRSPVLTRSSMMHRSGRGMTRVTCSAVVQLDLCSILLSRSFIQGRRQLDKDSQPHSVQ
jgi:hypothetical protein